MKSKRRALLIILLLPFIIIGIFVLIHYITYKTNKDPYKTFVLPRLEEAVFYITSISKEKTEINAKMLLDNPLPFALSADSIAYEFFISDTSVLKSTFRESISLKGKDTSWITIPVTVYNEKLFGILKQSEAKGMDSVYYEVKASFYSKLLPEHKFDFTVRRKLPLVHVPEVAIGKMEVDSGRVASFTLLVHAKIKNKNVFPMNAKDITYRFSVGGNQWIIGARPGLMSLPPGVETEVVFPVSVSLKEVGETIFTLLRHGKKVKYNFELTMKLQSDKNVLQNSQIIVKSDGVVEEIVELVKADIKKKRKQRKS